MYCQKKTSIFVRIPKKLFFNGVADMSNYAYINVFFYYIRGVGDQTRHPKKKDTRPSQQRKKEKGLFGV